jgi:hypothetical protein
MNLKEEIRSVLENGGYQTAIGASTSEIIYFEDENVVGAVFIHSSVNALLENWENLQDRFLGANSRAIRSDPIKAWNIYTVHVTEDHGVPSQNTDAFSVEQNFRGTRKIVRTGVSSRSDVQDAVLPLLPLLHRTVITTDNFAERYKERLHLTSKSLAKLVDFPDLPNVDQDILEES